MPLASASPTARAARRRLALVATILAAGSACDNGTSSVNVAIGAATPGPELARLDSIDPAAPPHVLYQVFGERGQPRMLPVAALVDGRIHALALTPDGWRQFDSVYHQPGKVYTIYQDGRAAGTARITRPMWDAAGAALYTLPGCRATTPLAAVDLKAPPPVGYLVEHLASDASLRRSAPAERATRRGGAAGRVAEARAVATRVAEAAGMDPADLDALDFRAVTVATGAADAPTLVISFIDPTGATTSPGNATHLFVLADRVGDAYAPTYTRLVRTQGATADYRRYVDHLDLTGDGVDELVLEGWSSGRESYMLILQFQEGRWAEVFRGRSSWCLD